MNILVTITTYRRPIMLARLVDQIAEQVAAEVKIYEDEVGGKENFWSLIDLIFKDVQGKKFDIWIHLPDDVELCPDFFTKGIETWNGIRRADPKAACLNPTRLSTDWRVQWVNFEPVEQHGAVRIGWNDCCWITGREMGDALRWRIHNIEPGLYVSSGVGRQISRRLHGYGNTMYGVKETLLMHGDHPSIMHPKERKLVPLTT